MFAMKPSYSQPLFEDSWRRWIADSWTAGKAITLNTIQRSGKKDSVRYEDPRNAGQFVDLYFAHQYAVLDYDAARKQVLLYNPHGNSFWIDHAALNDYFKGITTAR